MLKNRYGTPSTHTDILRGMIQDFIRKHPGFFDYSYRSMGMMYLTDLYCPDIITQFTEENKHLLTSLHIETIPNKHLLAYPEALKNSYFYEGDMQEFTEPDQKVGSYVGSS